MHIGQDDVQCQQEIADTFCLSFIVNPADRDRWAIIFASSIFSLNTKLAKPIILSLNHPLTNHFSSTSQSSFLPCQPSRHTKQTLLSHLLLIRMHREYLAHPLPHKKILHISQYKKSLFQYKGYKSSSASVFFEGAFIGGQYQVEMSLSIFAVRNEWYRNGIWWFTKMANRLIGESRYNAIRVQRRILSNKFYYLRQHLLYRCYIESPDVANMIGIYPKTDSSHGYGNPICYEMYRDFQENTINSDGSFGMWTVVICAIYVAHAIYSYFIPWYWNKTASCKNGEEQRIRIRDALSSTIIEDSMGYQFLEWGFNPHYTYYVRHKLVEGHAHPDDVRAMACSGLTRKNRYVEHFGHIENKRMIGPF